MKIQMLTAILAFAVCIGLITHPVQSSAAIKDYMDAGLSLRAAIVKEMKEGKTCDDIMAEALEAVADVLVVVEAAIKAGLDTVCVVAKAIEAGGDPKAVADTAMAAGASLEDVRKGLAEGGFPSPDQYVYIPLAPPGFPFGPSSPIAGGVCAGGGGRTASPTVPGRP